MRMKRDKRKYYSDHQYTVIILIKQDEFIISELGLFKQLTIWVI